MGIKSFVAGNMFAAALIVAGDYTVHRWEANSQSAEMQSATDSTALMLARDAERLTPQVLKKKASELFDAMYRRAEKPKVEAIFHAGETKLVEVKASNAKQTDWLLRLVGVSALPLSAHSTVKWTGDLRRY